jgi:hypothetical protein
MKSPRKPYAIVPPEVWPLIQAAFLSGLSASVVAARYGATVHAIRKRASREGWTKRDYARVLAARGEGPQPPERDPNAEAQGPVKPLGGEPPRGGADAAEGPPPDPRDVLAAAVATASRMLMQGRGGEAQAMVRAAEGLVRLADLAAEVAARFEPVPTSAEIFADITAKREADWAKIEQRARELLGDCNLPAGYTCDAFRWRAQHLGPEAAEADRERARRGGWYDQVFEPDGSVISPEKERVENAREFAQYLPLAERESFLHEVGA